MTNACKYAYGATRGEVRVSLRRDEERSFVLTVEDDGCGIIAETGPTGTGLGTKLIAAMAKSLRSAVDYSECRVGTCATLRATTN